ncbi:sigma-70 family RNA polymerase sigma factor [Nocardioides sp. Kera G14]|uniref:sigma-70 family RNA polymerase sigma factor n=1 Tax=Nocardioides sp. Kera G14 TaxID=2884264 RepID=UPI001D12CB0E|nr:FliA/WhiG family RNA polymerase sigma factor [Nocardioides sp. Kera G14]UDY24080.1 FliA/WhiG family RNA polymerase sigma factor [Nocardioides sp. Kera G14]
MTEHIPPSDDPRVAHELLITSTMPLVGHIVRETMGRVPSHVSRDDLTSAGLTALVQAAKAYDAERGVPFERYAATRIRGAILDELRSVDWASRSVRRRARDLEETRTRLTSALGRTPSVAEVASALGMSVEEVAANEDDVARAQILSLHGATTASLDELIPTRAPSPEALLEHQEKLVYLAEAIEELPERLRIVVQDYFFAERPMADIAAELGVTDSRISQMRAEALVLLRDALNSQLEPSLVQPVGKEGGCASRRRESYFAAVAARHAESARRGLTVVEASRGQYDEAG